MEVIENFDTIFNLKPGIFNFLRKIRGTRDGFYHYSLTGDYFGEKIKWGLGNAIFFLRIVYILDLEKSFSSEVVKAIKFINSFKTVDGYYCDPLVRILSWPRRLYYFLKSWKKDDYSYYFIKLAETRQVISTLSLFDIKCDLPNNFFPSEVSIDWIQKFLNNLDWSKPWGAGSRFSHLLFFLNISDFPQKETLVNAAIAWLNSVRQNDGFWYRGQASLQQKINGAMKIFTGLQVVNKINVSDAEKIIDTCLNAKNDAQACDNFNIIYVLKNCHQLIPSYRQIEVKDFATERLKIYFKYYHPSQGGFSFNEKRASYLYYGAPLSRGKNEPDIHGTTMFLLGISQIAKILKVDFGVRELDVV